MSVSMALAERNRLPLHRRLLPLLAVTVARPLAGLRPAPLRVVLELVRRGATASSTAQALVARHEVVSVSLRCAGSNCLQRSIATALLCRARGTWPTWHTGVRTHPFGAHAWVEADGEPVGEPHPRGYFKPILTVAPSGAPDVAGER